jgi:NAD(P)-dependent dehydrogenase (short-subunit alcohol dehydrogenase family)
MKRSITLSNQVAIVTGGAQGIGKALCTGLAESGAKVIIADINDKKASETISELRNSDLNVEFIKADITDNQQINHLVDRVLQKYHTVDILINNAGISRKNPIESFTEEDWYKVMDVNLNAPFFLSQAVGKVMIQKKKGKIINVASMSAYIVNKGVHQISYNVSKSGIKMLTKCLAAEWGKYNIQVNAIAPGYVFTEMTKKALAKPEIMEERINGIPLSRIAEPEDLVGAILFLASDSSSYITGHCIVIDGGFTLW